MGIAALLERDGAALWPIDGTPRRIRHAGAEIDVAIQDELGKVDLNAASKQTLQALFVAAGLSEGDAERLADTLADWRDRDDETRAKGAERERYEAQGYRYGPRNGPLESTAELEQLSSGSRAVVRRLAPAVTVHTRQPFIDPATAPRLSIEATTARDDGGHDRGAAAARTASAIPDLAGRTFTIHATDPQTVSPAAPRSDSPGSRRIRSWSASERSARSGPDVDRQKPVQGNQDRSDVHGISTLTSIYSSADEAVICGSQTRPFI